MDSGYSQISDKHRFNDFKWFLVFIYFYIWLGNLLFCSNGKVKANEKSNIVLNNNLMRVQKVCLGIYTFIFCSFLFYEGMKKGKPVFLLIKARIGTMTVKNRAIIESME